MRAQLLHMRAMSRSVKEERPVALWLFVSAALVWTMVVLGGVTRLTGSGLSIVEWQPVSGALPPLGERAWAEAFRGYQRSPEYLTINTGLTLDGFKSIFWMEWVHRLVGRLTGGVLAIPFLYWLWRRRLPARIRPALWMAMGLIAVQGLIGWLMVKSGLIDVPHVSAYRLVLHLGTALLLFLVLLWSALELWLGESSRRWSGVTRAAAGFVALVFLTALYGGFMAGLKAGHYWNTFPLIGDEWLPAGAFAAQPWWRNLFENVLTVQVLHRYLAKAVVVAAGVMVWRVFRRTRELRARRAVLAVSGVALLQGTLGVLTLLWRVPLVLGAAHQATAVLLLASGVTLVQVLRRAEPELEALSAGAAGRDVTTTPAAEAPSTSVAPLAG